MSFEKTYWLKNTKKVIEMSLEAQSHRCNVLGNDFVVNKGVFSPKFFPSTQWFAKELQSLTADSTKFLEIGTGSGAISICLAKTHEKLEVVATDITEKSITNAKQNVIAHSMQSRVTLIKSDVFDNVPDQKYCVVFWAAPFGYVNTRPQEELVTVFDFHYENMKKYARFRKRFTKVPKRVLIAFSKTLGNYSYYKDFCSTLGLQIILLKEHKTIIENDKEVDMGIYELQVG